MEWRRSLGMFVVQRGRRGGGGGVRSLGRGGGGGVGVWRRGGRSYHWVHTIWGKGSHKGGEEQEGNTQWGFGEGVVGHCTEQEENISRGFQLTSGRVGFE